METRSAAGDGALIRRLLLCTYPNDPAPHPGSDIRALGSPQSLLFGDSQPVIRQGFWIAGVGLLRRQIIADIFLPAEEVGFAAGP